MESSSLLNCLISRSLASTTCSLQIIDIHGCQTQRNLLRLGCDRALCNHHSLRSNSCTLSVFSRICFHLCFCIRSLSCKDGGLSEYCRILHEILASSANGGGREADLELGQLHLELLDLRGHFIGKHAGFLKSIASAVEILKGLLLRGMEKKIACNVHGSFHLIIILSAVGVGLTWSTGGYIMLRLATETPDSS